MALDVNRIAQAVAEAVLEDQKTPQPTQKPSGRKKLITTPRALLLGAGLFTAGRLIVGPRARDVVGNLQDRLVEFEHRHLMDNGDAPAGEEDLDEEEFDEEELDDEPEGEYDEEEPEGEYDEDEPEGEYDEDEPEGEYDEEEPDGDYDEEEPEEEPSRSASG